MNLLWKILQLQDRKLNGMSTVIIREHLVKIIDGLKKVDDIVRQLGDAPEQESLELAIAKREVIMRNDIEKRAKELSIAFPAWHEQARTDSILCLLLGEMEKLTHSIMHMDEHFIYVLRRRMNEIDKKKVSLYHTSRAAYSYTANSRLSLTR
jgi:hypothetical protein